MSYFMDYRQEIEDAELDIYDKMSEELEEAIKHGDNADVLEKEYAMSTFVLLTERHHTMDEIEYLAHGDDADNYSEIIEECEDKLSHLCDEFDELEKDMEEAIMAGGVLGEKWEKRREKNEIAHYGIHGQRWGVRNYENYDGSLTEEGKARYGKESDGRKSRAEARAEAKAAKKEAKAAKKEAKAQEKLLNEYKQAAIKSDIAEIKNGAADRAMSVGNMSDDELWKATQRNLDEARYLKSFEDKSAVMSRHLESKGARLAQEGVAIASAILQTGGDVLSLIASVQPNIITDSQGNEYTNDRKVALILAGGGAKIAADAGGALASFLDPGRAIDNIRY